MTDCTNCKKTVYFVEKVEANGRPYHKMCFKCAHNGCRLTLANFHCHNGILFCRKHVPAPEQSIRRVAMKSVAT